MMLLHADKKSSATSASVHGRMRSIVKQSASVTRCKLAATILNLCTKYYMKLQIYNYKLVKVPG